MLEKFIKQLLTLCSYQPQHRDLYLFLTKFFFCANLFWLIGCLLCSYSLGVSAYASEILMFYLFFLLIISLASTVLVKRLISQEKVLLGDLLYQNRATLFLQTVSIGGLFGLVALSFGFALLTRASKTLPALGYILKETYDGIEPLFMVGYLLIFLVGALLPLFTPFFMLLVKSPMHEWGAVFKEKVYPRLMTSFSTLFPIYLLWCGIEVMKCMVEWIFPVQGLLSALIRSSLYSIVEALLFFPSLQAFIEAARAKRE